MWLWLDEAGWSSLGKAGMKVAAVAIVVGHGWGYRRHVIGRGWSWDRRHHRRARLGLLVGGRAAGWVEGLVTC